MFKEEVTLNLLQEAIERSKSKYKEDGYSFRFYGILFLVIALCHLGLWCTSYRTTAGFVWILIWPVSLLASFVKKMSAHREQKVVREYDQSMKGFWIGFNVALALAIGILSYKSYAAIIPIILVITGLGTYFSAALMDFKPFFWGSLVCWLLSVTSVLLDIPGQLLCFMVAMVVCYIVPGFKLKKRASAS